MIKSDLITLAGLAAIIATALMARAAVVFYRARELRAFNKEYNKAFGHILSPTDKNRRR